MTNYKEYRVERSNLISTWKIQYEEIKVSRIVAYF